MIKLSFMDKVKKLIEIVNTQPNSLLLLISLFIIFLIILFTCKKNSKLLKIIYATIYLSIIGILIYLYYSEILSFFDYLIECIVNNILFPNLAIYVGMILIINIIMLISIISNKVKFYIKSINIIGFIIMQLFLYLIINNVIVNEINIYEKLSIYTNQELLILIELSMQLFVVWLLVLGMIRLIDYLMDKVPHKKENNEIINNDLIINNNDNIYQNYEYKQEYIEYVPIKKIKRI